MPQSDTEAFLWSQKAAEAGLTKAMYAVGYFLEVGIGTPQNTTESVCLIFHVLYLTTVGYRAMSWYRRAADKGDKRAAQRLKGPNQHHGGPGSVLDRDDSEGGKSNGKECIIM